MPVHKSPNGGTPVRNIEVEQQAAAANLTNVKTTIMNFAEGLDQGMNPCKAKKVCVPAKAADMTEERLRKCADAGLTAPEIAVAFRCVEVGDVLEKCESLKIELSTIQQKDLSPEDLTRARYLKHRSNGVAKNVIQKMYGFKAPAPFYDYLRKIGCHPEPAVATAPEPEPETEPEIVPSCEPSEINYNEIQWVYNNEPLIAASIITLKADMSISLSAELRRHFDGQRIKIGPAPQSVQKIFIAQSDIADGGFMVRWRNGGFKARTICNVMTRKGLKLPAQYAMTLDPDTGIWKGNLIQRHQGK